MEKIGNYVVPNKIPSEINYKIICVCFLSAIIFHYSMFYLSTLDGQAKNADYIIDIVSIITPLVTSIFAFVIAGFYRMSKIFGRAYIFLGLAYLCASTAETIYTVQYDIIGADPYPSIADLFFAAFSIFWILHVVTIIKYFGTTIEYRKLIIFIVIFCSIILSYTWISLYHLQLEPNFEFFYGLLFVVLSSITLPLVLYAAIIFKNSALGKAWSLLLISFLINVSGDVWYYYLEIFNNYDLYHPVNFFWYIGYWLQTYALFKHKKVT